MGDAIMSSQIGNIAIASTPGELTVYRDPTQAEIDMIAIIQTPVIEPPSIIDQLYALYLSMSVADQIEYAPYFGTINILVSQGQIAEAKLIVSGLTVSTEDQSLQQQMVALLGG